MKLKVGQILIAKTSFQNTNTIDSFFIKDKKYTIRIVHIEQNRPFYDETSIFRSMDYIVVNNLPGYTFNIEDIYKSRKDYIWNCFYTPNEIRKNKLEKIKQNCTY